jgi:photosystem II stability/assembly factor-like uncharacterized protein
MAIVADRQSFYLATKREVYRSNGPDAKWESIFCLPAGSNAINCLAAKGGRIFIGTTKGLFRSLDRGSTWKNVFNSIIPGRSNIIFIEISAHDPRNVLIGAASGVFMSRDSGARWQNITANLKNKAIRCVTLNRNSIYAGGDSGLYALKEGMCNWERIFIKSAAGEQAAAAPESEDGGEAGTGSDEAMEESDSGIRAIAVDGDRIYIGTGRKIQYSENGGKEWRAFPAEGLAGSVNYILPQAKSKGLYCATSKGVFEFDSSASRWQELYKGMGISRGVNRIVFAGGDDKKALWAMTENGIYRLESANFIPDKARDVEKGIKSLKVIYDNEPAFRELQQAAIRYAEVNPEKIKRWRTESRMRALFPKVSFGVDRASSSTAEIYTSATKDYIVTGPDDVSKGWDVSLSWELGDLIWSDDQTNIDVRSRLMVQLRNDILDDLRRAYFERKKIQFELMTEPPQDLKARFDKELRLRELTQAIDDLTGNCLSERSKSAEDVALKRPQ